MEEMETMALKSKKGIKKKWVYSHVSSNTRMLIFIISSKLEVGRGSSRVVNEFTIFT